MSSEQEVFKAVTGKAARSGRRPTFDVATAKKIVALAQERGIGVIGLEGFIVKGKAVTPVADTALDFSEDFGDYGRNWNNVVVRSCAHASFYLAQWAAAPESFRVEISLVSEAEFLDLSRLVDENSGMLGPQRS